MNVVNSVAHIMNILFELSTIRLPEKYKEINGKLLCTKKLIDCLNVTEHMVDYVSYIMDRVQTTC